jgi:hypothetical protein
MRHLGARADDWHSGNPNVNPGAWIALIIGIAALAVVVVAATGSYLNGNGSPFLSSI